MYFDIFHTEEEIKKRYRFLALRLHPDKGGDVTVMKEVNEAFEQAIQNLQRKTSKPHSERTYHKEEASTFESTQKKLNAILAWAESRPDFDTEFVRSVKSQLFEKGCISFAQERAIMKIIINFKIPL